MFSSLATLSKPFLGILSGLDGTFSTTFFPSLTLVASVAFVFLIGNLAGFYLDK